MTFRAVITDIGGVLSDHKDLTPLDPWVEKLNMPAEKILETVFSNEVEARAALGQATPEDVWNFANQTFGLSEADKQALIVDFWATKTWDQELLDFLRSLKSDYKIGALSDAWPDARVSNQKATDGVFEVVVYSAEEGIKKPNPEIYRRTVERLGIQPEEAIYIDDSPNKVEGAQKFGMHALLFTDTASIRQQITELLK